MNLIEEIKKNLKMEIRPGSKGNDYLEAVVGRKNIESLQSILIKYLGTAAKQAGKEAKFPEEIQRMVDALGGLRIEQSFFYKKEGSKVAYAALWPWESDPENITLKSGYAEL